MMVERKVTFVVTRHRVRIEAAMDLHYLVEDLTAEMQRISTGIDWSTVKIITRPNEADSGFCDIVMEVQADG